MHTLIHVFFEYPCYLLLLLVHCLQDDFGLGIPIWNWPDQESELQSRTSSDGKKIKKMRTVESHQSVVPAQALMELFLATDSIPKRIFGVKLFKQFQAIREILLAGETNRYWVLD